MDDSQHYSQSSLIRPSPSGTLVHAYFYQALKKQPWITAGPEATTASTISITLIILEMIEYSGGSNTVISFPILLQ